MKRHYQAHIISKKKSIFAHLIRIYQIEIVKQERTRHEIKEARNPTQKAKDDWVENFRKRAMW